MSNEPEERRERAVGRIRDRAVPAGSGVSAPARERSREGSFLLPRGLEGGHELQQTRRLLFQALRRSGTLLDQRRVLLRALIDRCDRGIDLHDARRLLFRRSVDLAHQVSHSANLGDDIVAPASPTRLLRLLGYAAQTVYDGNEAIAAVKAERPDVILLDLDMPVLNGFDAARAIRVSHPQPPPTIVAVSALAHLSSEAKLRECGFDHYLTKPADMDRLVAIVEGNA